MATLLVGRRPSRGGGGGCQRGVVTRPRVRERDDGMRASLAAAFACVSTASSRTCPGGPPARRRQLRGSSRNSPPKDSGPADLLTPSAPQQRIDSPDAKLPCAVALAAGGETFPDTLASGRSDAAAERSNTRYNFDRVVGVRCHGFRTSPQSQASRCWGRPDTATRGLPETPQRRLLSGAAACEKSYSASCGECSCRQFPHQLKALGLRVARGHPGSASRIIFKLPPKAGTLCWVETF